MFKTDKHHEIRDFAVSKMREHGLYTWYFEFGNMKRRLGDCTYGIQRIRYSNFYLHLPEEEWKDTILHEIAHALAGPAAKHGPVWRAMAREVGAKPQRTYKGPLTSSAQHTWELQHAGTGKVYQRRFRKPKSLNTTGVFIRGEKAVTLNNLVWVHVGGAA